MVFSNKGRCLLLLLVFSFTLPAWADKKMSLITISQGSSLFEAFGHTMVLVENSENPDEALFYEFGGVDMSRAMKPKLASSNDEEQASGTELLLEQFTKLFESKVEALGSIIHSKYREEDEHFKRMPLYLFNHYMSSRKEKNHREIKINVLKLSPEQQVVFEQKLIDEVGKGPYFYQNYKNNCVTKIRDMLFSNEIYGIPTPQLFPLFYDEKNISFQDLSKESIDEAIERKCIKRDPKVCTKNLEVLPAEMARSPEGRSAKGMLAMLGLPDSGAFASADEMHQSIAAADGTIGTFVPMFYKNSKLPVAFHNYFFGPEITRKPLTRWERTYTPKELYRVLLEIGFISDNAGNETILFNDLQ